MKATLKSCLCRQCTRAKHGAGGKKFVKPEEISHRHDAKRALAMDPENADILPAGRGSRIG